MHQVVIIHGGNSFTTYDEFISWMKSFEIQEIDYFKRRVDWKPWLEESLGSTFQVLYPLMPNKQNAKYAEWKTWFERLVPFLQDEVILVGHSLGGSFLTRYLSEVKLPCRVKATLIIAAPFDTNGHRVMHEFALPDSLSLFEEQAGSIFLYHSEDDPSVPFEEHDKFLKALPKATSYTFKDRKHFNQETFPELSEQIKTLTNPS